MNIEIYPVKVIITDNVRPIFSVKCSYDITEPVCDVFPLIPRNKKNHYMISLQNVCHQPK